MAKCQEKHTRRHEHGKYPRNKNRECHRNRAKIPENWTRGTIVYIYKNKGGPGGCGNYRPICLTQIIYKIRPGLVTRKLTKIAHILTRNNQLGYKEGISTIDAIIRVEQYIESANRDAKILLMGISKAFGAINRTLLWTTLYKKGIPIDMTKHIRQGHQDTKLEPKYKVNTDRYHQAT